MLYITADGHVDAGTKIKMKIIPNIERGALDKVNGIVVHQTGGSTAESAYSSYRLPNANGAHFLIDLDGQTYQTASIFRMTYHVGYQQSLCWNRKTCAPSEFKALHDIGWKPAVISRREGNKNWPDRYPNNTDALGIEIVGEARKIAGEKEKVYDPVNDAQNSSLKWLVKELADSLHVSMHDVYRHPEIGRKNLTEARSAKW
jgi:N-acetyl-anhydromuramyl-L-alanine amidase AmpD